ncbi:hypothetical protein AB0I77_08435 [Streptomyces sp. NPDC050619]
MHAPGHRSKTISHPKVGPLTLITADAGTPSARALRHLLPAG